MTGEASRVTAKFEDEYLSLNGIIVTLGARGFSWAVSDFGQVITVTRSLTLLYIRDLKPTLNENITSEKLHL